VVSRRTLLLAGAGSAGALLSGCGTSPAGGGGRDGQPERDADRAADIALIGGLLVLEQQSVALYAHKPGRLFRRLAAHERQHVAQLEEELRRRGATAKPHGWMVAGGTPLELARRVEETSIAAYLDALPKIVDAGLRSVLATIVAAEASHLAEVRHAQGLVPADQPFVTGRRSL
jgi:hypothetical protein